MTKEQEDVKRIVPYEYYDTIVDVGHLVTSYGADTVAKDLLKNYPNETQQLMIAVSKLMKTPALFR